LHVLEAIKNNQSMVQMSSPGHSSVYHDKQCNTSDADLQASKLRLHSDRNQSAKNHFSLTLSQQDLDSELRSV